ncbi:MAG TPA: HGxxPAAW family protein [Segeticoccus sp.]|uniref:HGxxPAAW family protein n=1 Tax=Segeticoccus sp. TaxID=2706531 RepID=UPI002D7EE593|nr:HGxxPAAW family protein [Segeticoccus sp.]HET8599367.1 HGxxPAAW family protein [Segeticoccus sp.]
MAEHGHGHSTAAWTAVTTLLVAAALIAVGIALDSLVFALIGCGLVAVGLIAGKVLQMAGFGVHHPSHTRGTTAVR